MSVLRTALKDLGDDPDRPGVRHRDDLGPGIRTYHAAHTSRRVGLVRRPRHLFLFRIAADGAVEVARILHDAMDVARHVPSDFRSDDPDPDEAGPG